MRSRNTPFPLIGGILVSNGSKYLSQNSDTRLFRECIACAVGLHEAIVLNQIQYWLGMYESQGTHYYDGKYWVYNTYEEWQKQFRFWTVDGIKRIFKRLVEKKLLIVGNYNKLKFDRTNWYTINYDELDRICGEYEAQSTDFTHSVQSTQCKVDEIPTPKCTLSTNNTIDYTYTTTETTLNSIKGSTFGKVDDAPEHKKDLDYSILDKQINKMFDMCFELEDCHKDIIRYIIRRYFEEYKNRFNKSHTPLSNTSMIGVIERLSGALCDLDYIGKDDWDVLIEKHFDTKYEDCDYNVCHFASNEILNNRFFETLY